VEYILSESNGTTTILDSKSINVVADGDTRVSFTAQFPQGPVDQSAEHRVRVQGELRGKEFNISQSSVTVSGTVTASGDTVGTNTVPGDNGVDNATVTITPDDSRFDSTTVQTDANGSCDADIPFGPATITVEKTDYVTATRNTTGKFGGITEDLQLDYGKSSTLEGTITLGTVDPDENVTVMIEADGNITATTTVDINESNDTGGYSLDLPVDVRSGYTVSANATNYEENTSLTSRSMSTRRPPRTSR
jgi:hypothetical protein